MIERQRVVAGQHPIVMSRDYVLCSCWFLSFHFNQLLWNGRHMQTIVDLSFSFLFPFLPYFVQIPLKLPYSIL